jgi:WD40 repeat protein
LASDFFLRQGGVTGYLDWGPIRLEALTGDIFAIWGVVKPADTRVLRLTILKAGDQPTVWQTEYPQEASIFALAAVPEADLLLIDHRSYLDALVLSNGTRKWKTKKSSSFDLREAALLGTTNQIAVPAEHERDKSTWIKLLDLDSGAELRSWSLPGFVNDLAATADGEVVVAAVGDNQWEGLLAFTVRDGAPLARIELNAEPRQLVATSDPDQVAVLDDAQALSVWSLSTGDRRRTLSHGRLSGDHSLATAADVAVTVSPATLRPWSTRTGEELAQYVPEGSPSSVSLSPDGTRVAYLTNRPQVSVSGRTFQVAVIWTPADPGEPVILPVEDVQNLKFDRTGENLILIGKDGKFLRVLDSETLVTRLDLQPLRNGKLSSDTREVPEVLSDDRLLVVKESAKYRGGRRTHYRNATRAFDLETGREIVRLDRGQRTKIIPNSNELLVQGADRRYRLMSLSGDRLDRRLSPRSTGLRVSRTSPLMLTAGRWDGADLIDLESGEIRALMTATRDHLHLDAAALSPDGRYAALAELTVVENRFGPTNLVVKDTRDGSELARTTIEECVAGLGFAGGGSTLLIKLQGKKNTLESSPLLFWKWASEGPVDLVRHNPVPRIAASRDGAFFVTAESFYDASDDGLKIVGTPQIRLWDAKDGSLLWRHETDIVGATVAVSPDSRHVVAIRNLRDELLDAADGSLIATIGPAQ